MSEEIEEKKEEIKLMRGELVGEELEAIIAKYPKLKRIIFEEGDFLSEGEKGVVYVKNFTLPLYEQALLIEAEKNSTFKLATWVLKNLRVAGMTEAEITSDIDWFKNFAAIANTITFVKRGEIKKN
jgi:hypothetical protein